MLGYPTPLIFVRGLRLAFRLKVTAGSRFFRTVLRPVCNSR